MNINCIVSLNREANHCLITIHRSIASAQLPKVDLSRYYRQTRLHVCPIDLIDRFDRFQRLNYKRMEIFQSAAISYEVFFSLETKRNNSNIDFNISVKTAVERAKQMTDRWDGPRAATETLGVRLAFWDVAPVSAAATLLISGTKKHICESSVTRSVVSRRTPFSR